ncbi:nucleotidyltransferase family protein [bacterium CPR1]|nr:nucleotidyltransferase family protein [bacterium CPR1]
MRGAALVLAAGRSQRMGRSKAGLELGQSTFLGTILQRLPADLWVAVVVGEKTPLPDGVRGVVNRRPEDGQLSSLRLGLRAGAAELPFTLVALVDLPCVAASTYLRLVDAAEGGQGDLWVPSQGGRRGHPVVFGQVCYEDLLHGPLEEGSRWVVGRHRSRRVEVEVDDPEIHRDVDTPEDYRRLLEDSEGS